MTPNNILAPCNSLITAVLIDGAFFINRYRVVFKNGKQHSPTIMANNLTKMVQIHIENQYLYRVLFYDCKPFDQKIYNPYTNSTIDYSMTNTAKFRLEFFEELKKKRKFALRLGELKPTKEWIIDPLVLKKLLKKEITIDEINKEYDLKYELLQKGVDIKIGLDIASLAIKKMVNKIILVSGDSDFVPAAKLARREGIDFVLDPMWNPIRPNLFEHIDGLYSTCPNPLTNYDKDKYPYIK